MKAREFGDITPDIHGSFYKRICTRCKKRQKSLTKSKCQYCGELIEAGITPAEEAKEDV